MENYSFAQQGWQCPICRRVYSPLTPVCFYCGGESKTWTSTEAEFKRPEFTWERQSDELTSNPPKYKWKCRRCGKELILDEGMLPTDFCDCVFKND